MNKLILLTTLFLSLSLANLIAQRDKLTSDSNEYNYELLEQVQEMEIMKFTNYKRGTNLIYQDEYPERINKLLAIVRKQIVAGKVQPLSGEIQVLVQDELLKVDSTKNNFSVIYGVFFKERNQYFVRVRQLAGKKREYYGLSFSILENKIVPVLNNDFSRLWINVVSFMKYKQVRKFFGGIYSKNRGIDYLKKACIKDDALQKNAALNCMLTHLFSLDDTERNEILDFLN